MAKRRRVQGPGAVEGQAAAADIMSVPANKRSAKPRTWFGHYWERLAGAGVILVAVATAVGNLHGGLTGGLEIYEKVSGFLRPSVQTGAQVGSVPELPVRPLSIVVFPFQNLSSDPEQQYFVQGLTEDITSYLGHIRGTFVISSRTALTYLDKKLDVRQISRELGVQYVLDGSVRRSGAQVRVNVKLADGRSGKELWADSFDRELSDVLKLQSDITARLARTLDLALFDAEARRIIEVQKTNPDAIDLVMHGWALINNRQTNQANLEAAASVLKRAIAKDPNSVRALLGLAKVHVGNAINLFVEDKESEINEADKLLTRVFSIDPDNAHAHYVKGLIYRAQNLPERSIEEYETAIALDQSLAPAYVQIGQSFMRLGQAEKTFDYVESGLRISPRDPNRSIWLFVQGSAYLYLGSEEKAIQALRKASEADPDYPTTYVLLAAANAMIGNQLEAQRALRDLDRVSPGYSIRKYRSFAAGDNPIFVSQVERVCGGLRKAGLPEG